MTREAPTVDAEHADAASTDDVLDYSDEGWATRVARNYFWFVLKNVIGWLAIIASPILGVLLPGPGGIPLVVVGFALVTLPGKRRLTTHVFRGRRLPIESPWFTGLITFFSVAVTAGLMWAVGHYYDGIVSRVPWLQRTGLDNVARLIGITALAAPVTMVMTWLGLKLVNYILLRWVPPIRRLLRRTLRKWGVDLLPTRRRRIGGRTRVVEDEIISLDDQQRRKIVRTAQWLLPWLTRLIVVSLTLAALYFVVEPVTREWDAVAGRLGELDLLPIALGTTMFAVGLLLFRVAVWRQALVGLGHALPPTAAARIWSLGHVTRNLPGRSFVVLRMELTRPYGPSGPQAHAAGRTEGGLAVIAAIVVGLAACWWTAWTNLPTWRPLWLLAIAATPVLFVLVSRKVFYRLVPVAGRSGKTRLATGRLLPLASWQVLGVLFQGLAVWMLVSDPLAPEAPGRVLLATTGAWGLAFAAGRLATIVPAGLGIRELVFVAALTLLMPEELELAAMAGFEESAKQKLDAAHQGLVDGEAGVDLSTIIGLLDPASWKDAWWAFLLFVAILLRIATTAAEVLLAAAATAADWRSLVAFIQGAPMSAQADARSSDPSDDDPSHEPN
ncbi:MAG: hypothetical protein AAF561_15975 [Planctomycetota bacterium]